MKLGENVLVEIVNTFLVGLSENKDVSEMLRDIDVVASADGQKVVLSDEYLEKHDRK